MRNFQRRFNPDRAAQAVSPEKHVLYHAVSELFQSRPGRPGRFAHGHGFLLAFHAKFQSRPGRPGRFALVF